MTTTLNCTLVPSEHISESALAVFDVSGQLLMTELHPGALLPDNFDVQAEDGVVFSVVRSGAWHKIDDDDMDIFTAMVFG